MFGVKIYKQGKDGLELKETVSAEKCSEIHWNGVKGDPLRSGMDKNGVRFHRLGVSKKCAEHKFGCENMIDDNRKTICSPSCQRKRLARQRFHSKQNQLQRARIAKQKTEPFKCVVCAKEFYQSRSDHRLCSRLCRNKVGNKNRSSKPRTSKYSQ